MVIKNRSKIIYVIKQKGGKLNTEPGIVHLERGVLMALNFNLLSKIL